MIQLSLGLKVLRANGEDAQETLILGLSDNACWHCFSWYLELQILLTVGSHWTTRLRAPFLCIDPLISSVSLSVTIA